MTLEAKAGGQLILKSANAPEGAYKISHHFDVAPDGFGGKVAWSVNESPAKLFPKAKSADAFLFRGDTLRLLLTAEGSEGLVITLPFGCYRETRLRLPKHVRSDYWTGFWLLAGDVVAGRTTDTRLGTEVDIFETFNQWNLGRMSHNLHWGGYGKTHNAGGKETGPHLELLDGQFHTYGLYWDETKYVYYIDGVAIMETDALGLGAAKGKDGAPLAKSQGTCRKPAFIKISVEAAPWCGPTSQWENFLPPEDTLVVDYVRLYQKKLN
ncbi:MAG: glycoside hydrolase family 16 protein [Verrucomicrobiota bacterium]